MSNASRSCLSEEKIVQPPVDMQAGDLVEVSLVTEHCESMLQRAGSDPHVISRNGTAAVSEFPIHYRAIRLDILTIRASGMTSSSLTYILG